MAEGSAVSVVSSVVSDRGSSEDDEVEYSLLNRPYQYEPLAREDTESVEDQLDIDGCREIEDVSVRLVQMEGSSVSCGIAILIT